MSFQSAKQIFLISMTFPGLECKFQVPWLSVTFPWPCEPCVILGLHCRRRLKLVLGPSSENWKGEVVVWLNYKVSREHMLCWSGKSWMPVISDQTKMGILWIGLITINNWRLQKSQVKWNICWTLCNVCTIYISAHWWGLLINFPTHGLKKKTVRGSFSFTWSVHEHLLTCFVFLLRNDGFKFYLTKAQLL